MSPTDESYRQLSIALDELLDLGRYQPSDAREEFLERLTDYIKDTIEEAFQNRRVSL